MHSEYSQSVEDYLKAIFELQAEGELVSTKQLAASLGVAPPSVTGMLQKLAAQQPPLIHYHKHRGVLLTTAGRRAALGVVRHHRLLEAFLFETLGYSWENVHEEAHRLEHAISAEFAARIDQLLGSPRFDPHGDPIPGPDLELPPATQLRLSDLRNKAAGKIQRVSSKDPEILCIFSRLNLLPGVDFRLLSCTPESQSSGQTSGQTWLLQINHIGEKPAFAQPVRIGSTLADHIFIEVIKNHD